MTVAAKKAFSTEGGLKELINLFFPILLMTFTNCLFLLIEKLLLARLSTKDMEAAVSAAYACQIFQFPCIAIALMAQVFVGRWLGAKDLQSIGPGIWQFIWFSFLSMIITVPCSIFYGNYYFKGSGVEHIVMPYFYTLVSINFLFPLTTTLTCFFLGQGKTRLVVLGTIGSQLLKLTLAFLLIFGFADLIPAFGLIGGALSTFFANSALCLILFMAFIHSRNAKIYNSRNYLLKPRLFWNCIHPGILRALSKVLLLTSWASIAHLMSAKGGDYLLVLSVGGTLFLFLPFMGDAVCQAQITVVSYLLGSKSYHLLDRAIRSATILLLCTIGISSIPFIVFPSETFLLLFPLIKLEPNVIQKLFLGIWICFAFFTLCFVPISYILACKDTKYFIFMGVMNWIYGYLLMYIIIEKITIEADQFWIALSIMHAIGALLYFWRMKWFQSKLVKQQDVALVRN